MTKMQMQTQMKMYQAMMKAYMGAAGTSPMTESYEMDTLVSRVINAASLNGDEVKIIYLSESPEYATDPRIVILKATEKGTYIKEVGVRVSHDKFVLYESK